MDINPRMNGIHSLAEGLGAFEKFHKNPKDVFALKDSILRSHHALETLFKDILYQANPVFLVSEDVKIKRIINEYEKVVKGENVTILDELKTVSLKDVVDRLWKLNFSPKPNSTNQTDFNLRIFINIGNWLV